MSLDRLRAHVAPRKGVLAISHVHNRDWPNLSSGSAMTATELAEQTQRRATMSETGMSLASEVALGDMPIGVQHFIKAGCHFGHQTKRWNPKMRPFIYGARNGIHIIDLDQTAQLFKRAYNFVVEEIGRAHV